PAAVLGIWEGDFVLAAHFGISLICFGAVFLLPLLGFEVDLKFGATKLEVGSFLRYNTIFVTTYIYVVVNSDALGRHTDVPLEYLSWPHCNPGHIMPTNLYEAVQMGPRALAGIAIIWIFLIMTHAIRHYSQYRVLHYGWIIAFILIILQMITGLLSVFT